MSHTEYEQIESKGGVPIKAWTRGVPIEEQAREQLLNVAKLPFIHRWVAVMPDVHWGIGATIGSVIPTCDAVIPAAVGVDIGCGMMAVRTSLAASDLPDTLRALRTAIEKAVPHGRTHNGGPNDRGAWRNPPETHMKAWAPLQQRLKPILDQHERLARGSSFSQLGTLGTGNHFIEICLDREDNVWFMLHSGSRGVGNRIGTYFIELAKKDARRACLELPDANLAYFREGSEHFDQYVQAVQWAQDFASANRALMMQSIVAAVQDSGEVPAFRLEQKAINCHHNYVARERHYGRDILVTRKGAVRARRGDLGIIPGSMGTRSYIVRGLGNPESFESCSHGAGRAMSRTEARRRFSVEDHAKATASVECRKDAEVIDETPMAYKSIDAVMAAQRGLVEVVHELKQIICVKG